MSHDPLVSALGDICREHKTAEKWLVMPSLALGHTIVERLALSGYPSINLRPTTPVHLARTITAPILSARQIAALPDAIGPALIGRLLAELPTAEASYFQELADSPGLAEALWSAILEVRLCGLRPQDLTDGRFVSPIKARELRALLSAYEQYLEAEQTADTAVMLRVAVEQMPRDRVAANRLVLIPTDVAWCPLEHVLISAMPGRHIPLPHATPQGLLVPRRLEGVEERETSPLASATGPSGGAQLAWLFDPESAPAVSTGETLEWFHAAGHEAEVHEVLRRALASGAPWDAIEIACTADEPYVTLIWETCARLGVPVTLAAGVPVTMNRPGRALLGFCRWIEEDFAGGQLRRLLQSGDITLDLPDGPSPGQAARLLARCEIAWGRETYARSLQGLIQSLRAEAEQAAADSETEELIWREKRVGHAEALANWIHTVLELVPLVAPDGRIDETALVRGCLAWMDRYVAVSGPLDGTARQALIEGLTALGELPPMRQRLTAALGQVVAVVEQLRVGPERPRPGYLHVTRLAEAGWTGRQRTFVVGLDQGVFPGTAVPEPILLDDERQRLHEGLPRTGDRIAEALYGGASRLAALGGRVTLSYSNRDLQDDRLLFPSSVMLQAFRLKQRNRALTYEHLAAALGEPVTRLPATQAEALDDSGWWLRGARQAGTAARPAVSAAFPWLGAGEAAEEARDDVDFTAWDGWVTSAAGHLDPRQSGRPISPTAIEELAKCPFRYFLKRGLRLEPSKDIERDPGAWLDPLRRGSLLHEVFAAFLRDCRERRIKPDPTGDRARIQEIGEHALAAMRQQVPPPNEAVFAHEREEILADLQHFLAFTSGLQSREVVGIEVAFGRGALENRDPLAQEEPIVLHLGQDLQFSVHGRIDRIDRVSPHGYEVVDYKSGRRWPREKRLSRLAHGRQLQHALYALAATELLKKRDSAAQVVGAAYWFPTGRGERDVVPRKPEEWQALPGLISLLLSLLNDGVFPQTAISRECEWCDVAVACGPEPWRRAKMKRAEGTSRLLDAVRALEEKEYA